MNKPRKRFRFLPLSVRLETKGGVATPLVLRGTPLPAVRSDVFATAVDNQTSVGVALYMGESSLVRNNIELGAFNLNGIPRAKAGEPQINVEFSVDTNCAVTAKATLKGGKLSAERKFRAPNLSREFIDKKLAEAEKSRIADEAELAELQTADRAKALIAQAEERLKTGPNNELSESVAALGLALSAGNKEEIRKKVEALEELVAPSSFFSPSFTRDVFGDLFETSRGTPKRRPTPAAQKVRSAGPAPSQKEALAPSVPQHTLGKIFGGGNFVLDSQLFFVLMPFDSKLQPIYEDHIRPTIQNAELRCERADEILGPRTITSDIWERINREIGRAH